MSRPQPERVPEHLSYPVLPFTTAQPPCDAHKCHSGTSAKLREVPCVCAAGRLPSCNLHGRCGIPKTRGYMGKEDAAELGWRERCSRV